MIYEKKNYRGMQDHVDSGESRRRVRDKVNNNHVDLDVISRVAICKRKKQW